MKIKVIPYGTWRMLWQSRIPWGSTCHTFSMLERLVSMRTQGLLLFAEAKHKVMQNAEAASLAVSRVCVSITCVHNHFSLCVSSYQLAGCSIPTWHLPYLLPALDCRHHVTQHLWPVWDMESCCKSYSSSHCYSEKCSHPIESSSRMSQPLLYILRWRNVWISLKPYLNTLIKVTDHYLSFLGQHTPIGNILFSLYGWGLS